MRFSGTLLMLGSAVSFSTIGLFTRAIAAPLPEVLVIRGISGALAIWVVARLFTKQRWTDRANFRWPALAVALLFTLGMTSLVVAYRIGSVVNVSVVYATIPLVIGLFQLVFRRRRPSEQPRCRSVRHQFRLRRSGTLAVYPVRRPGLKALIEYAESAHLRLAGWADSAYWIDTYEEGKCHHF